MKRSILLALAGLLASTGLVACGGNNATPTPTASPTPVEALTGISPGSFGQAGPMTARYFHTATLLKDGRVLIVGGCCGSTSTGVGGSTAASDAKALASAELYNPSTGKFTATGSMKVGRYFHTATLLPTGRVLIAGGFNENGALASAEIFDPTTGVFTSTANMTTQRSQHTATLLKDGRVLIAGGSPGGSTAELYNESSGKFTTLPDMWQKRYAHTATLLKDGRVLLVGGQMTLAQGTAELFNPLTGHFDPIGTLTRTPLDANRYYHAATLLNDGRVLITGGVPGRTSAELYDPGQGIFTVTGPMKVGRYDHTATLLPSGKVLIAGSWPLGTTAELYDPKTGQFSLTGSMAFARARQTATLMNDGRVLIAGGAGNFYGTTPAEIYKP